MAWSNDAEDAKILLDIPSQINDGINVKLTLGLVDIYLDNTLQVLCKPLL